MALTDRQLLANDTARERTWAFMKAHWTELEPKIAIFGGDTTVTAAVIPPASHLPSPSASGARPKPDTSK